MKDLVIPGIEFLALGGDKLYNKENVVTTPVGAEKDAMMRWIQDHIDRLARAVKDENRIVVTMGENKSGTIVLKFAAFSVEDGHVKREKREKTIKAKECGFFTVSELDTLAKDIRAGGLPAGVTKKDDKCTVLGMFVRAAILDNHPLLVWIPPELMEILSEEPYKTMLRSKLK
jgi:hypothetical protein